MAANPEPPQPIAFGLIVIGDELLNGTRVDHHLGAFKERLIARGHELAWHWLLPDDPQRLIKQLRLSMAEPEPVFVCGGIGATPDDHTRACAAAAHGVPMARHAAAEALIEGRFGADAYPNRIRMADLPAGCDLIPNPVNQIPGFSLAGHWFLPGFPAMAWPMADWVLDQHYQSAPPLTECSVRVLGTPESALVPLMEALAPRLAGAKLFSLPHLGEDPHVLLGLRGRGDLTPAMAALCAALTAAAMPFESAPSVTARPGPVTGK